MTAHTVVSSALLVTFFNTASLQVAQSATYIADKDSVWRSTLTAKHPFQRPARLSESEANALSHEPTCVPPVHRWGVAQTSNERAAAAAILPSLVHIARNNRNAVIAILLRDQSHFPRRSFARALQSALKMAGKRSRSVL